MSEDYYGDLVAGYTKAEVAATPAFRVTDKRSTDMKTIRFYAATNRSDNLLHIETDGCIVNIRVGLTDQDGHQVTAVSISPEDESRGGDGEGNVWVAAEDSNALVTRIVRHTREEN